MGIIVIDTGARINRFKYSNKVVGDDGKETISTSVKLRDLIKKAKCWKNYDRTLEERYFDIKRSNGEVFTSLDKKDLATFTINEILTMMNISSGEFHVISNTRYITMEVDFNDDASL